MRISSREARERFSELLDLAEQGEEIVVTRRGKASVRLVAEPVAASRGPLPDLTEFRARIAVSGSLTGSLMEEREDARY